MFSIIRMSLSLASLLLVSLILVLSHTPQATADIIKIRSDLWCPYNCEPNAKNPGYMIEVLKIIFEKKGHSIDYKLLNWSRSLEETRHGNYTAVVGASRSDAKGFVLPDLRFGITHYCFYTLKSNLWQFSGMTSLNGKTLGVVQDYSYGDPIDPYVKSNVAKIDAIKGDNTALRSLQKVQLGRIEVYVEDKNVVEYSLAQNPKIMADIKNAGCVSDTDDLFVAFSPSNPKSQEYAKLFSQGLKELRKSGELKKILKKYNLKDFKNPK